MTHSLVQITIGLVLLSVLFWIIERVCGASKGKPWFRRQWLTDVGWWFFLPLVGKWFTRFAVFVPAAILIALGVTQAETLQQRLYTGFGPVGAQPLWLQALQIYLISDFFSYWTHRLFHGGRWWPFHAVHHSSEDLDWLGSVRVHPVNEFVNKFVQVTPLLLLGYNPLAVGSAPFFLTLYAIFLHANVNWSFGPLKYVIATPVFHRWHHSKDKEAWDKNFAGLFPFWDLVFGTFYMPKDRLPENFGILEPMPASLPGQLIQPFKQFLSHPKADPATSRPPSAAKV
jgi:sterol desaturase/sphingolipid hydroxylase (fatty acid hydroxylase superfamily)